MDKQPATYVLASQRNGTLYTGVTSDLIGRTWQHKHHLVAVLVWYEIHHSMESAILREKRIKKWRRAWKIELVETMNPYWNDLWETICTGSTTLGPRFRGDDGQESIA